MAHNSSDQTQSMHPKVVVVGSCFTDLISYAPRLPRPGETLMGTKFLTGFGGKGANQCVAAAKLGAKTAMIGRVGNDTFGNSYVKNFQDNNVDITHLAVTDTNATGTAGIMVGGSGDNIIIVVGGANTEITPQHIEQAEEMIKSAVVLVCQLEIPLLPTVTALKLAKKHGTKSILNAAPASADFDPNLYPFIDILCVNEPELELLTGIPVSSPEDAEKGAAILISKGCNTLIVTLGNKGAVYVNKITGTTSVSAEIVPVVDTTGAGDAFVGAFAYYLAYHSNLPIKDILQRSCYIASMSVQTEGTQRSYQKRKDLPVAMFE